MTCDPADVACQLAQIVLALESTNPWTTYFIPIAAIVVTLGLGIATVALGVAANKTGKAASEISAQVAALTERQHELLERKERQVYADAVLKHYEGRRANIREGTDRNMPHYTSEVEAAGELVDAPRKQALLDWLTSSIWHVLNDGPEHDRSLNARWLRDQVPIVVAKWVRNPGEFDEPAFRMWHEYREDEKG